MHRNRLVRKTGVSLVPAKQQLLVLTWSDHNQHRDLNKRKITRFHWHQSPAQSSQFGQQDHLTSPAVTDGDAACPSLLGFLRTSPTAAGPAVTPTQI